MKIDIRQITSEELTLSEQFTPGVLDLETDIIKFRSPIKAKAQVTKISNAVTIFLNLEALMLSNCSRCLNEIEIGFKKSATLNYPANNSEPIIDLDPDIREEIILDYPIKPLCSQDCLGLCPKCGKNLNEGGCTCGIT